MNRVLLVIDVQNEYFTGKLPVTFPSGSLENISKSIDVAREHNIPIVIVQHTSLSTDSSTFIKGTNEWNLHPQVAMKPYDCLIEKNKPSSFTDTNLEFWLRERNIDTIVICGYMTQMCCDTTARHGFYIGFSIEFLSDATGTLEISNYAGTIKDEELHRGILVTQAMRFSKVLTTDEWIKNITM